MLLALMGVAAGRVGLPDLHELPAHRASLAVEDPTRDGDALADGLPGVLPGEVVVDRGEIAFAEGGEDSSTISGSLVTSIATAGCRGWRSTEER